MDIVERLWLSSDVKLLVKGNWSADQLVVWPLVEKKEDVPIYPGLLKPIEENWAEIQKKNPRAFAGPTFRLANYHQNDSELVVEVVPSDYSQGGFLGWLGVAMVPITSDGFVAMQGHVDSIATTVGGGTRVPGCTPTHVGYIAHTINEMKEEFNIKVTRDQLTVLGLMEALPPIARRHNIVLIRVSLEETFEELREKWQDAEDKWEGELTSFKLGSDNPLDKSIASISQLALLLISESEGFSF